MFEYVCSFQNIFGGELWTPFQLVGGGVFYNPQTPR